MPPLLIQSSSNQMLKTFFQKPSIFRKSISSIAHLKSKLLGDIQRESQSLFDLLHHLLAIDPKDRYDCRQALQHPFFQR